MKKLSIGDLVSRAWDLSVKHWPVFLILSLIEGVAGGLSGGNTSAFSALGKNPDPQEVMEALTGAFNPLTMVIAILLSTYLSFVTYRMLVNVMNIGRPYEEGQLLEVLKIDLVKFGLFIGVQLVMGFAEGIGYLCCIIPGIILTIRWWFTPLIAATEDVTFSEAFGLSWEITKGHFWELFLLGITCIGIAIVGFFACCVGMFFAEVIINFIVVLAYYELSNDGAEVGNIF